MFIGRKRELEILNGLKAKKNGSLVAITGRRRIGKSRLATEFGKSYKFYSFFGFPPTPDTTAQDQRRNFSLQLEKYFHTPVRYDSWYEMFCFLSNATLAENVVILFDEISWMGSKDNEFLGSLKTVWDQEFSKNNQLVLLICGSISTWIERNILSSTGFLGRISLRIDLKGLSLKESVEFWDHKHASSYDIFKILSVTGGVPRYLEEVNVKQSAEENIKNLCFTAGGVLVNEFDQIFSDLFDNKHDLYRRIVIALMNGPQTRNEVASQISLPSNGILTEYLEDLEKAGFISRNYTWHIKSEAKSSLSCYRISDNYVRFYLKYILPNLDGIKKGNFTEINLLNLEHWSSVMGLQFENLVINNRKLILEKLGILPETVINDGPYFQKKTKRADGCQIDYLVQAKLNELYVIEIKFSRRELDKGIISEMENKLNALTKPKNYSIRPVVIHVNGIQDNVAEEGYFYKIIDFSSLLD
jgi:AAA+ ATPase superfamily predicted ATPase